MGSEITFSSDDLPTPEQRAEWQDMIESLREYVPKELSRYERDFLDGIETQLAERRYLTLKQREFLESLHASHLG